MPKAFIKSNVSPENPSLYVKHLPFIPLDTEFREGNIAYINMIREPVNRYASVFYYTLSGRRNKVKAEKDRLRGLGIKNQTLSWCFQNNTCKSEFFGIAGWDSLTKYFCEYRKEFEKYCGTDKAVEEAINNMTNTSVL